MTSGSSCWQGQRSLRYVVTGCRWKGATGYSCRGERPIGSYAPPKGPTGSRSACRVNNSTPSERYRHGVDDAGLAGRAANLARWDEAAPLHAASETYDLAGFRAGRDDIRPFEISELGPVSGLDL